MDQSSQQGLWSVVRSLLIAAGAWLAAHDYIDQGSADQIIGSIMVAGPLIWGVVDKYLAERDTKKREVIAVNAGIALSNADPNPTPMIVTTDAKPVIEALNPTGKGVAP